MNRRVEDGRCGMLKERRNYLDLPACLSFCLMCGERMMLRAEARTAKQFE
jgi:hypothetical protein